MMKKIMALTMVAIFIAHHYPDDDDDDDDANSKTAMTSAISTLSCQVSPPPHCQRQLHVFGSKDLSTQTMALTESQG